MDDHILQKHLQRQSNRLTISFSSADVHKVDRLERHLNGLGIRLIRYDRDLKSQENIQMYMERMLEADKIIILLSTAYLKSSFCVYELVHLKDVESKLIRVYADDQEPDFFKALYEAAAVWKQKKEATSPADWMEREIEKQDLDRMFREIETIFKLKYIRYEELFETQGERQFLESLAYTPEKYVNQLNEILEKELWTEREVEFDTYLKAAPANDVFYLKKALSYERENYLEAAVYFLQKSILLNERFLPAYLELCRMYLLHSEKKGLFDRHQLQKILAYEAQCAGDSRTLIYKVQGMLYYNDAKSAVIREDLLRSAGQAIFWFQKAEKMDPKDGTICNSKGLVYELLGKIARAAQCYERAIILHPQYYQAYNNLALLYSKYLNDSESAIRYYRRCLEMKPDYRYALNGLAILLEQENVDEAVDLYLRLICREVSRTEELTNLGLIFEEEKRDNRTAGSIYKIALEKEPYSVPKNFNYGNLLRKIGAPGAMVEQYLGYALKRFPASPMTNFSYGLFMMRESEVARAVEYFKKRIRRIINSSRPIVCLNIWKGPQVRHRRN